MPIQLRRRLTPEKREQIQNSLRERLASKPRQGMSARLFTGEDVKKHLEPMFSTFTTEQKKEIEQKSELISKSLKTHIETQIKTALGYFKTEIDRILANAVSNIRQPEDGHTPTPDEIRAIFSPMIASFFTKTDTKNISTPTTTSVLPDNFEKIIEEGVKKYTPNRNSGGGGVHNFYELSDVTKKTEKYGVPYKGFENKYVKVSPDGKKLIFDNASGGGFTELTATGVANGTNVTYTFTQVPSYIVADGLWYKPTAKNGTVFWTNVGLTVTMVNPPAYDIFGVA